VTIFPQPTWRSHPSTDFDAKWLKRRGFTQGCAFWSNKSQLFETPDPQTPKTAKICPILVGKEHFRSILRLTLGVSRVNTPYSSSEPNKSVLVNRQCGGEKFKYVPKFCIGVQVTWYRACAMTICTEQAFWRPISRKLLEIGAWSQWRSNRKRGTGSRMVTWPMTSRDPERSRSWPNYLWVQISPKRPEIEAWF